MGATICGVVSLMDIVIMNLLLIVNTLQAYSGGLRAE